MQRIKILFSFLFFFFFALETSFALDWQNIHQKAADLEVAEAESIFQKNPELSNQYLLGVTYLKEYEVSRAEEVFREILKEDPSSLFARWGKLECLRRRYECQKECQDALSEIIETKPAFAPPYITLAYLNYQKRDFDQTSSLSRQVIRMGQKKVDTTNYVRALALYGGSRGMAAHFGGPIAKIMSGRQARPYLIRAKRVDPESVVVHFGLGSYYLLTPLGGSIEKAKEHLKKAIEIDPKFAETYVRLAQVYKAQGDKESYNKYLEKALELEPQNYLALDIKEGVCNFICLD